MEEVDEMEDVLQAYPIKKYFTPYQYENLSQEERQKYAKMKQEYEVLSSLGMHIDMPTFMIRKSKYELEEGTTRPTTRQCATKDKDKEDVGNFEISSNKGVPVEIVPQVPNLEIIAETAPQMPSYEVTVKNVPQLPTDVAIKNEILPSSTESVNLNGATIGGINCFGVEMGDGMITGPEKDSFRVVGFLFRPESFLFSESAKGSDQLGEERSTQDEDAGSLEMETTELNAIEFARRDREAIQVEDIPSKGANQNENIGHVSGVTGDDDGSPKKEELCSNVKGFDGEEQIHSDDDVDEQGDDSDDLFDNVFDSDDDEEEDEEEEGNNIMIDFVKEIDGPSDSDDDDAADDDDDAGDDDADDAESTGSKNENSFEKKIERANQRLIHEYDDVGEEEYSGSGEEDEKEILRVRQEIVHDDDDVDEEENMEDSRSGEEDEEEIERASHEIVHEDDDVEEEVEEEGSREEEEKNTQSGEGDEKEIEAASHEIVDEGDVVEEEDNSIDEDENEKEVVVVVVEVEEDEKKAEVISHVAVKERKAKKQMPLGLSAILAEKAKRATKNRLMKARRTLEAKRIKEFQEAVPPPPLKPKPEYPCGVCGFVFKRSTHLRRHQVSRMGADGLTCIAKPEKKTVFECDTCGKVFNRAFNMNRHIERRHLKKEEVEGNSVNIEKVALLNNDLEDRLIPSVLKCSSESEVCNSRNDPCSDTKINHVVEGNTNNNKPSLSLNLHDDAIPTISSPISVKNVKEFKCEKCAKAFSRSNNLKRHMLTHTDERPFECAVCGKGFKQAAHLVDHERLHTGDKSFQCSVCNLQFTQRSHLVTHQNIHTKEKLFKCDICGKEFLRSDYLLFHKRTHEKEKLKKLGEQVDQKNTRNKSNCSTIESKRCKKELWECCICDKQFPSALALDGHKKSHDKTEVECDVCGQVFSHTTYLSSHKRVHKLKHKCDVCGKEYSNDKNFQAHKRLHICTSISMDAEKDQIKAGEKRGSVEMVQNPSKRRKRLKTEPKVP